MTLAATSQMNATEFYDLMDKELAPILSRTDGVAQINLIGGQEREIKVSIDALKLEGYGLSLLQVQNAILTSNLDFPTGSVKTREQSVIIRLSGKFKNVEELRKLVILENKDGVQIRLEDVADVQDGEKDVEKIARVNQKSAIIAQVIKQTDANAVEVSKTIQEQIKKVEKDYSGVDLKITLN